MKNWNEEIPILEQHLSRCYYDIAKNRADAIELLMKSKVSSGRAGALEKKISDLRSKVYEMENITYPKLESDLAYAREQKKWADKVISANPYFLNEVEAFVKKHVRKKDRAHSKEDLSPEGVLCELVRHIEDNGLVPELLLKGESKDNYLDGCAYNVCSMHFRIRYVRENDIGSIQYVVYG